MAGVIRLHRGLRRYQGTLTITICVPLPQQASRKNSVALVVEKILVPLPFDELRQHHRDGPIRVLPFDLQDVIDDRLHHESKR